MCICLPSSKLALSLLCYRGTTNVGQTLNSFPIARTKEHHDPIILHTTETFLCFLVCYIYIFLIKVYFILCMKNNYMCTHGKKLSSSPVLRRSTICGLGTRLRVRMHWKMASFETGSSCLCCEWHMTWVNFKFCALRYTLYQLKRH